MLLSWERWVEGTKPEHISVPVLTLKLFFPYSKSINLYLCTVQCNAPFDNAQPQ